MADAVAAARVRCQARLDALVTPRVISAIERQATTSRDQPGSPRLSISIVQEVLVEGSIRDQPVAGALSPGCAYRLRIALHEAGHSRDATTDYFSGTSVAYLRFVWWTGSRESDARLHIYYMSTVTAHQRCGIATALLDMAMDLQDSLRIPRLRAQIEGSASQRLLHRAHGFELSTSASGMPVATRVLPGRPGRFARLMLTLSRRRDLRRHRSA